MDTVVPQEATDALHGLLVPQDVADRHPHDPQPNKPPNNPREEHRPADEYVAAGAHDVAAGTAAGAAE